MSMSEPQRLRKENVQQYKRIAELRQIAEGLIAVHEEMWATVTEDSCSRRCVKEWDALVREFEREP